MNYRDLIGVGLVSLVLGSGALGTVAGPSGEETRTVDRQTIVASYDHIRHIRVAKPLTVKVDGRTGRGVVTFGSTE